MLKEVIETWLEPYACQLRQPERPLNIGLVLAGNIPMVGFHDILCVLVSGHRALIKMSSQDNELTSWMLGKMGEADQEYASRIQVRSEEHTSELQSLMRISYAVFCLKKKKTKNN